MKKPFKNLWVLIVLLCFTVPNKAKAQKDGNTIVWIVAQTSGNLNECAIDKTVVKIEDFHGDAVQYFKNTDRNFLQDNIASTRSEVSNALTAESKLFVYVIGRGIGNNNDEYPSLLIPKSSAEKEKDILEKPDMVLRQYAISLKEYFYDAFEGNCKLVFVSGDMDNSSQYMDRAAIKESCKNQTLNLPTAPQASIRPSRALKAVQYDAKNTSGTLNVLCNSSKRGQFANFPACKGAIFTSFLLQELAKAPKENFSTVAAEKIVATTDARYAAYRKEVGEEGKTINNKGLYGFKVWLRNLFKKKNKIPKEIKKIIKDVKSKTAGKNYTDAEMLMLIDALETEVLLPNEAGIPRYKAAPHLLTIAKAAISNNNENSTQVLKANCELNQLLKRMDELEDGDRKLLKKLGKAFEDVKIYGRTTEDKLVFLSCVECLDRQASLQNKVMDSKEEFNRLTEESNQLEREIEDLEDEKMDLEDSIASLQQELASTAQYDTLYEVVEENPQDLTQSAKFTITIPRVKDLENLPCYDDVLAELEKGNYNFSPSQLQENPCLNEFLKAVEIKQNPDFSLGGSIVKLSSAKGVTFGKGCDEEIRRYAKADIVVLKSDIRRFLSARVGKEGIDVRDCAAGMKLEIEVTGFADNVPCVTCRLKGQENKTYTYIDKNGNGHSISLQAGVWKKITNQELAFERALCAASTIIEELENIVLNDGSVVGIPRLNIKFKFVTHVSNKKGDDYRGVKIRSNLVDLYNADCASSRPAQIVENQNWKRKTRELNRMKRRLDNLESELEDKNTRFVAVKEEIKAVNRAYMINQQALDEVRSGQ